METRAAVPSWRATVESRLGRAAFLGALDFQTIIGRHLVYTTTERPEIKYDSLEWGGKRMRASGLSRVWNIHCACDATRAALFATVLCASMNSATLQ